MPAAWKDAIPRPWSTEAEVEFSDDDFLGGAGPADPTAPAGPDLSRPKNERPPTQSKGKNHTYLPNGHLVPNPAAQHPIYDLIDRSEREWQRKLDGQSTTLREAVDEYRRRYHRAPPKGFDKWWHWAQKAGIPLPDEYDQIHHDLEPYWAIRPADFRANAEAASKMDGMYTITCAGKAGGGTECTEKVQGEGLEPEVHLVLTQRSVAQLELIKPLEELLYDTKAVFYMHDGPWQFVGHDYSGEYISKEALADLDTVHLGWGSGCAPHKPLRQSWDPSSLVDVEALWQTAPHSFVYDHKATMDVCTNPNLVQLMGVLNSHGKGPGSSHIMYPTMAMSKTTLHSDILAVSAEAWTEDVGDDPEWDDKKQNLLLWRGKTTGILYTDRFHWNVTQRVNLVSHAARREGTLPVLPVSPPSSPVGAPEMREYASLNKQLLDAAFVDEPIQCEGDVCNELREQYHFADRKDWTAANDYKFLLDVDGNGWSARFKRLMSTNSAVLKSTIFPEWYTDRIQPWKHYIPIKADLTDLYDVMSFFQEHDDLGKRVANQGKEWSKTFWRQEDMMSYQFRLFLELARLESDDRDAASYHGRGDEDEPAHVDELPSADEGAPGAEDGAKAAEETGPSEKVQPSADEETPGEPKDAAPAPAPAAPPAEADKPANKPADKPEDKPEDAEKPEKPEELTASD
ncbi:hypothetical protein CC85DRAFT_272298 [Cutaneotrichosporon oleaginosum]|uniref:Glycosyl transferase CAP10 domain-containing protein n=1 Tax=Cutaneotrichosporon oleaginosum TaxID=879819 RepID=A0A0J0XRA0_9TREE|nr:uncharacterized protein CC85DRAFT_272298 [Cutaneotrichosporon oleaginosum]KLT43587.1 hypothetical protein CC85DRAFT_272298 [Cutaneotrichosporon oleaginosum]TXT12744.1 hypothetical protein COLE_03154 [Cutaneotrichosporon oleaginosum]